MNESKAGIINGLYIFGIIIAITIIIVMGSVYSYIWISNNTAMFFHTLGIIIFVTLITLVIYEGITTVIFIKKYNFKKFNTIPSEVYQLATIFYCIGFVFSIYITINMIYYVLLAPFASILFDPISFEEYLRTYLNSIIIGSIISIPFSIYAVSRTLNITFKK